MNLTKIFKTAAISVGLTVGSIGAYNFFLNEDLSANQKASMGAIPMVAGFGTAAVACFIRTKKEQQV